LAKKGIKGIGDGGATLALLAPSIPVIITVVAKLAGVKMKNIQTDPNAPGYDASIENDTEINSSTLNGELAGGDEGDPQTQTDAQRNEGGSTDSSAHAPYNVQPQQEGFKSESERETASDALNSHTTDDKPNAGGTKTEGGNEEKKPGGKDNTALYVGLGLVGLFVVGKGLHWF
jgi:hypothetical protein